MVCLFAREVAPSHCLVLLESTHSSVPHLHHLQAVRNDESSAKLSCLARLRHWSARHFLRTCLSTGSLAGGALVTRIIALILALRSHPLLLHSGTSLWSTRVFMRSCVLSCSLSPISILAEFKMTKRHELRPQCLYKCDNVSSRQSCVSNTTIVNNSSRKQIGTTAPKEEGEAQVALRANTNRSSTFPHAAGRKRYRRGAPSPQRKAVYRAQISKEGDFAK